MNMRWSYLFWNASVQV